MNATTPAIDRREKAELLDAIAQQIETRERLDSRVRQGQRAISARNLRGPSRVGMVAGSFLPRIH